MNKNKKGLILTVVALLGLIVITTGVTFAFFNYTKQGTTDNSVTTGTITFLYTEVSGVGRGISIKDAYPVSDEVGKAQTGEGKVFDFKVTSTTPSNASIPYEITARKNADSTLDDEAVRIYLTKVSGDSEEEVLLDNYSNLTQTAKVDSNKYIEKTLYTGKVPAGSSNYEQAYRLRMWIDESIDFSPVKDEEGNDTYPYNNKEFTVTVNVYANAKVVTDEEVAYESNIGISSLSVNEKELSKETDEDYDYNSILPIGTVSTVLDIVPVNPNAVVDVKRIDSLAYSSNVKRLSLNNDLELIPGDNYFKITVTSENKKESKDYKLKVIVLKETDIILKSLDLTSCTLSPTFNSNTTNYSCTVGNNVKSTLVSAEIDSTIAQVKGTGDKSLSLGENKINVDIVIDGKTEKTYTIEVNRQKDTTNTLKSLSLTNCPLNETFNPNTINYTCTVENDATTTTVSATATSSVASVSGTGSKNLIEGTNTIQVTVTSQSGSKKTYTIVATKEANGMLLTDAIFKKYTTIYENPTLTKTSNAAGDSNGLYKSTATNSGDPTYYFRGNVTNNYVDFAGQTWRVVRINEDGTIRLIMSTGIDSNGGYKFHSLSSSYTHMYYSNSTAKTVLENWYTTNIINKGYSSRVASGDYYCEQAKVKSSSSYTSQKATMTLYSSYTPNFKCSNDGNGYGIVNSNIGLITYDEVVYAGGYFNKTNTDYYLYNNKYFWTMSPVGLLSSTLIREWDVTSTGAVGEYTVNNIDGHTFRPVINLNADVRVEGTGSSSDHWVIQ